MRILLLTQWFDPEPAFKGLRFAKELTRRGHTVEVLTGFPNYPGGKVYSGYRIRLFARETMDGIPVTRVALYPSHDRSALKRIVNYASFALSAGFLGPLLVKKADVTYVYHPPPTVGFIAMMLRLARRIPYIYDIQDLWPDSLAATGMIRNERALAMVAKWCSTVYRKAASIVVLSPGFKDRLVSRGVPEEKIHVLYNWAPDERNETSDEPRTAASEPLRPGKFTILFAGNMGAAQALDCILAAAEVMQKTVPQAHFALLGSGICLEELKKSAREKGLQNVSFLPRVTANEAAMISRRADALLVHLKNDPLFRITIPSKTQSYLAAGKPILIGVEGDAARLVESANAGFSFEPENPKSLIDAVQRLLMLSPEEREAMGENGRAFYKANLSLASAVGKLEPILNEVSKQSG